MGFESHKIVKEYVGELDRLIEVRDLVRAQLEEAWQRSYKAKDDEERRTYVKAAKDLEQQVNSLTSKGELYMLKIDQLNGVR